jgi:uncharacterized membrane protein
MSKKQSLVKSEKPSPPEASEARPKVQMYSGPIPDPAALEHYESILPGSPERILSMAEDEQRMQNSRLEKEYELQKMSLVNQAFELRLFSRGQIWAGSITIAAIGLTALGGWLQNPYLLSGGLLTTIAGVVKIFMPSTDRNTDNKK